MPDYYRYRVFRYLHLHNIQAHAFADITYFVQSRAKIQLNFLASQNDLLESRNEFVS